MIVKNEAANLEAALGPVKEIVDEVVVVDTGSTDDTVAIAEKLGARVHHFRWCDSFAAARNAAIEQATGDWIFILDADDRVVPPELEKLRALFGKLGDENAAYMMGQVSLAVDGGVALEVEHVRLFRRRPDVRYRYRVHEQVVPDVMQTGGAMVPTNVRLVHVGYRKAGALDEKVLRNIRLVEMDCADFPTDPFPMFYRGAMLADLGRSAEAIVALSFAAMLVDPRSAMGRTLAYSLARAQRAELLLPDALDTIRAARVLGPNEASLACLEAELLIELGDLSGAGACLTNLAMEDKRDLGVQDVRLRVLFGEVLLSLGFHEAAEQAVRPLTESRPGFGLGWLVLADALLAQGRISDVDGIVERLDGIRGASAARAVVRAAQLFRGGHHEEAASLIDAALDGSHESLLLERFRERMNAKGSPRVPFASCLAPPWVPAQKRP